VCSSDLRLLHAAERKIFGHNAPRTKAVEIGESLGLTVGTAVAASVVPATLAVLVGGPVGLVMSTVVGGVVGMVAGAMEENGLGLGRVAGELVGRGVDVVHRGVDKVLHREHPEPRDPAPQKPAPEPKKPASKVGQAASWVGRQAMSTLGAMGEPIMSTLIDAAGLSSRVFSEKAWQTMDFTPRPMPQVNRNRLLDNFVKLTGINGTYKNEEKIADEVGAQLTALNVPFVRQANGNIIATVPGTVQDAPTVMLSAHMDTVKPTQASAIRRDEDGVHTDEHHILGADDRAGIAEILEGVRVVLDEKLDHPELKLVFTIGEEAGLRGAATLKHSDISTRPTLGYVMDSLDVKTVNLTNDAVITTPSSVKYNFHQEDPLVQVALRSMANAGTPVRVIHAGILPGAGSDANSAAFNSGPIRSIDLGAGYSDPHTSLEGIKNDDMVAAARHVVGLVTNACDLKVEGDRIVPRQALDEG
jgi:tripeptide aminopeptidase